MFFIPGFLISIITFPGVIVHEFAHKLFCIMTHTHVREVCYFRFGNPAGYVIHDMPNTIWKHILIGIGPFIVNSIIGLSIGLIIVFLKDIGQIKYFLVWLGVSIAMHSFPSSGDAKSIWSALWKEETPLSAKIVGTPLVGCIMLVSLGSMFWLDLFYGVAIIFLLPKTILG